MTAPEPVEDLADDLDLEAERVQLPAVWSLVTCQGCGLVRRGEWLGKAHACWRNDDGSYEEGGTFQ